MLISTTIGSYPPTPFEPGSGSLSDLEVEKLIRRAIADQKAAAQKYDDVSWLYVDGQPRSDVVGIFAHGVGLKGDRKPYQVSQEIEYRGPITLSDLRIAAEAAEGGRLKAHITGPTLMAESCELTASAPYRDPRELTLALARALAEEARLLTTSGLAIDYLQIDEPTLVYGADLELARDAVKIIAQASEVPVILHVCGDVGDPEILDALLDMPVHILSVEGQHLRDLASLDSDLLKRKDKRLALGCMPVNTNTLPNARWLERELLFAIERYGIDNLWGITPDCGLRWSDLEVAQKRLELLAEAVHTIASLLKHEHGRRE